VAKQRAGRTGEKYYDPQSKYKHRFQRLVKSQLPTGFKPIEKNKPVIVNCTFYFIPTKKQQQTKKFMKKLNSGEEIYYTKKPDRDNLDKWVLDAFNKLVFVDDNQVCEGRLAKYYSMEPRTEIEIIIPEGV